MFYLGTRASTHSVIHLRRGWRWFGYGGVHFCHREAAAAESPLVAGVVFGDERVVTRRLRGSLLPDGRFTFPAIVAFVRVGDDDTRCQIQTVLRIEINAAVNRSAARCVITRVRSPRTGHCNDRLTWCRGVQFVATGRRQNTGSGDDRRWSTFNVRLRMPIQVGTVAQTFVHLHEVFYFVCAAAT